MAKAQHAKAEVHDTLYIFYIEGNAQQLVHSWPAMSAFSNLI